MGYYVDIEKITLDDYKYILHGAYMIPSRQMLKENIDENIDVFKSKGIENVAQLQRYLKSKPKLKKISEKVGLDEKYLNALRLELNAYLEKPTKIKDFACLSDEIKAKMESMGVDNTLEVYSRVQTKSDRKDLSKDIDISEDEVLFIAKLADLSRIRWVNHTFAYVLYLSGYDSVEKVAEADYKKVYEDVKKTNKENNIFKGSIGLNDIKLLVKLAGNLTKDIEY